MRVALTEAGARSTAAPPPGHSAAEPAPSEHQSEHGAQHSHSPRQAAMGEPKPPHLGFKNKEQVFCFLHAIVQACLACKPSFEQIIGAMPILSSGHRCETEKAVRSVLLAIASHETPGKSRHELERMKEDFERRTASEQAGAGASKRSHTFEDGSQLGAQVVDAFLSALDHLDTHGAAIKALVEHADKDFAADNQPPVTRGASCHLVALACIRARESILKTELCAARSAFGDVTNTSQAGASARAALREEDRRQVLGKFVLPEDTLRDTQAASGEALEGLRRALGARWEKFSNSNRTQQDAAEFFQLLVDAVDCEEQSTERGWLPIAMRVLGMAGPEAASKFRTIAMQQSIDPNRLSSIETQRRVASLATDAGPGDAEAAARPPSPGRPARSPDPGTFLASCVAKTTSAEDLRRIQLSSGIVPGRRAPTTSDGRIEQLPASVATDL